MTTPAPGSNGSDPVLVLHLFVAGEEANSRQARANIEQICEAHLRGRYELKVIDVLQDFRAAVAERVLVTPALIVKFPPPRAVLLGNLSDTARVLAALRIGETNK